MGKMKELSIKADNTAAFAQHVVDNDITLVTKVLDAIDTRQTAQSEAAGCKACEFLLQICEQGEVVCKVCGRDDYAK